MFCVYYVQAHLLSDASYFFVYSIESPTLNEKSLSQGDVSRSVVTESQKMTSSEEDIQTKFRTEDSPWSSIAGVSY